jgi:cholesterol oxidase
MIDVVVIGSGYGGSPIAARLAAHGSVLVIERGRRWRPGEFPEGIGALARTYRSRNNPGGLWEMRLGVGTGVAFASALGGSSVVNYGITVQPTAASFAGWPIAARELDPYFARARDVLRPSANPHADELGDKQFLDLVEPGRRRDLENTIDWQRCTQCGRCVPGCNQGAKRSLDQSYLALAEAAGARIRTETTVSDLVRDDAGWRVVLARGGTVEVVRARRVVIAAGTLGTLDFLHRVRSTVPLGPRFGQGMGLNGDGLAFLYDTRHQLSSHRGAPISTAVHLPFTDALGRERNLMVMSGRVPISAMRFTGAALAMLGTLARVRAPCSDATSSHWLRRLRDLMRIDEHGALARSFMYKLDGHDSSTGTARFTPGGVVVDWPDYAHEPVVQFAIERLAAWAREVGGTVIPHVATLPGNRTFSVHPLGGCQVGADLADGVVDSFGRVFRPDGGVYAGLRIADGSIVRGSIGVPPSFTIAALSERIAEDLIREATAQNHGGTCRS